MKHCLVNGLEKDNVPATDRGLYYGDGLFETIAVVSARPRNWQLHMQRLSKGCDALGLPSPDTEILFDEIARVAVDMNQAVVKIVLTRGSTGRGYQYDKNDTSLTRIVSSHDFPSYPQEHYEDGVCLRVCNTTVSTQPVLAGIKHLNRLENVLARNEWQGDSFAEGLMLDADNNVVEGTMSNLFWVEGEKLFTPLLDRCGVHGVMRQRVMETATDMGIECKEASASLERIKSADELFVTNSIIGIWPATLSSTPVRGKMTASLMQRLSETDGILFI